MKLDDIETPKYQEAGPDLTPLIDIIFQLLVFFMLTSSFLIPHLDLTLPSTSSEADRDERPDLVLSIDKNGAYYINGTPASEEHLADELKQVSQDANQEILYLHADKSVTYEKIITAISQGKDAGMKSIELMHEQ